MNRTTALVAAGLLAACTHRVTPRPPTPPVEKPPTAVTSPTSPVYTDALLRTHEGRLVLTDAHRPFEMRGAIFCWPPDNADGTPAKEIRASDGRKLPYMWTLISPELMDYANARGGANAFLVRLGPYRSDKQCCGMEAVGGPIQSLAGGVVTFNPRFDQLLLDIVDHAGRRGWVMVVSLDDGWGRKHQAWGEDVGYALTPEPAMTPERKQFVEHYVRLLDGFANVAWEVGNENDLQTGWTPAFERENYALIRATEKLVVHAVISNTRDADGPYEIMASHTRGAVDSPVNGKPQIVNEYNPAMSVGEFASCVAEMKARGSACWYWRSDGSDAIQDASLSVLKGGPITDYACPDPKPDRTKLAWWIDCSRMQSCDATPFQRGDHDYCVEIGMAEMSPGEARWNCPMRNEGDPHRVACEQYAMQRAAPKWRSDGDVSLVDGAGFRARTTGTWLQACDESEEHCSDRVPAP